MMFVKLLLMILVMVMRRSMRMILVHQVTLACYAMLMLMIDFETLASEVRRIRSVRMILVLCHAVLC